MTGMTRMAGMTGMTEDKRRTIVIYGIFTVYCFILMLLCTKSSPLYTFNDWFDANVYYTMGKGFFNGRVPYMDLIDNKGPLLYLIYGLSWLIHPGGFTGVYIFQSVFLTLSVIFVYRLALLFINNRSIAGLTALISPVPMLLQNFYAHRHDFGGGGPDEFCRALLIVSLFYFAYFYMKPQQYKLRHTVLQGVLFSCVFLMKFNLAAFWAGFLIVILVELIFRKEYKLLLKHLGGFFAGAWLTAAPYMIYAAVTKSLPAFFETYFLYNSIYSGTEGAESIGLKVVSSLANSVSNFGGRWAYGVMLLAGLVFVFTAFKSSFKTGYSLSLILFLTASFFTGVYTYTFIPVSVFLIPGLIALGSFLEKITKGHVFALQEKIAAAVLVFILTAGLNNLVTYTLFLSNEQTTQQRMASLIREYARSDAPSLLEIGGLDSGFYTAADILPDEPFFFVYNVSHELYPYPRDAQRAAVEEKRQEFVISRSFSNSESSDQTARSYKISKNYDEIAVMQGTGYQSIFDYHLYQEKAPGEIYDENAAGRIATVRHNFDCTPEDIYAMFDRDGSTRWSSGRSQQPGDYLIFDFKETVSYNCLFMDTGVYSGDYPRGLSVSVSADGEQWTDVKVLMKDEACFVRFEAQAYNHLRLTLGGSVSNWWGFYGIEFGYIGE